MNQEKGKEELKDSMAVIKTDESILRDSSLKMMDNIQRDLMETKKSEVTKKESKINKPTNSNISIRTFRNTEISGFGYDIILDGRVYVHQPNIPALPGNNGFATEEQARKVGELVIYKIGKNIMPPTVDVKELDSLGIK